MTDSVVSNPLTVRDCHPFVQELENEISELDRKITELRQLLEYMPQPGSYWWVPKSTVAKYPKYFRLGRKKNPNWDMATPKHYHTADNVKLELEYLYNKKCAVETLRWKVKLDALSDPS